MSDTPDDILVSKVLLEYKRRRHSRVIMRLQYSIQCICSTVDLLFQQQEVVGCCTRSIFQHN